MPNRLFALGDIHGCSKALKPLIGAIDPQLEDAIVVLGDVIDYGPDTKGVIQQLIDLSHRCRLVLLTGNHEEMMFCAFESPSELNSWIYSGGEDTLKCYPGRDENELIDPDHFDFLKRECREYYETDEFIFVHANYFPNLPMSRKTSRTLRWEFLEPERMAPHYSGKTVVAGHTPQTSGEVLDLVFLKVIDTDCSRGGWLTALEVGSGEVIHADQLGGITLDEKRLIAPRIGFIALFHPTGESCRFDSRPGAESKVMCMICIMQVGRDSPFVWSLPANMRDGSLPRAALANQRRSLYARQLGAKPSWTPTRPLLISISRNPTG